MAVSPSETPSKYDQKLEHILKTSAMVFAAKGYHSTSMRDISRATGMSLAGLYYYFQSKQELLFLIQDHCFSTVIDDCRKLIAAVDDPVARLKLLIENHLNYFVHNMNEMKVLSHEANSIRGDLLRKVNARKRQYVDLAMGLVAEIARQYRVRGLDVRVATFSLFGMMNWIYNWYDPKRDVDVQGLAQNVTRLFLSGFIGENNVDAGKLETGGSHLDRTVSIWSQQGRGVR
jgi:AcrR family transcriptional regulator